MDDVPIADAKVVAIARRCRGVLVVGFGGGRFVVTSYGHTRETCDAMKRVNQRIYDLIADGVIEIPAVLGAESPDQGE